MNICKRITVLVFVFSLLCGYNESARRNRRNKNTNRKAKCRTPEAVENAELKNKYKGLNKFKHGDKIEYDCKIGYTIAGSSRERVCRNGKWTDIKFICNEIFCSWLPHPENGRRVDTNSAIGWTTKFECNKGYQIRGNDKLLCRIDGEWYPQEPPVCDPILCPPLPQIKNGWNFQDTSDGLANDYESVAEYGCDTDYYLNGNPKQGSIIRTCTADGTWSGQEPFCDVPKCNYIMDFYGGYVDYFGERSLYTQAIYNCNENYTRIPDVEMSTCENNLQWHPPSPKCYSKSAVLVPENGYVRRQSTSPLLHGESYEIKCYSGYEVESDGVLTNRIERTKTIRNNNGTLEPKVQCLEERCDPWSVQNGYVTNKSNSRIVSKFPSGTDVFLYCYDGFQFYDNNGQPTERSPERLCMKGKIINAPKCIEEKCSLAKQPSNPFTRYWDPEKKAIISTSSKKYIDSRQRIEVFCDEQYELYFNDSKSYLDAHFIASCTKGKFDKNKFPVCIEKRCYFRALEAEGTCLFYDDHRKCVQGDFKVESGSTIQVRCKRGYELFVSEKKIDDKESLYCQKGTHPRFQCTPKNCTVPEIKNIEPLPKDVYNHGVEVTFTCKEGYHFGKKPSRKVYSRTSKCELGKWSPDAPKKCKPVKCILSIQAGTHYTLYDTNITLEKAENHDSGTNISIQCKEKFDLFDDENTLINNTSSIRVMMCYLGKWQNAHFCQKQCSIPNMENVQFSKDGEILSPEDTIIHNEIVNVTCKDEELLITCENGYLKGLEICITTTTTTTTSKAATSATSSPDSATKGLQRNSTEASNESTNQGKDDSKEESGDMNSDVKEDIDNFEGCTLSDDKRYKYVDTDYQDISPAGKIEVGTILIVLCSSPDIYSFLPFDYIDDHNYTDYGNAENTTITCNEDMEMSQHTLECPEVENNDDCMRVDNGEVKKSNGYYVVSCNEGFSLDTIVPEGKRCTCNDGILTSLIGGQPKCIPDPCEVPYEFDSLISISNRQFISLSGGSVVEDGDLVYFNCSKASEMAYEPFNRRFKCMKGLWIEDDRDKSWKFGNNGTFPKCRKAECDEECQNGGVCYKDNSCRCKHLTEGKLCENVICDGECIANGGKCIGPGICECPQGKFGNKCENRGCVLPQIENMSRLESPRAIFAPGESLPTLHCDEDYVLSSDSRITCRYDGSWSEIVMCEKGVMYRIMVKTSSSIGAGTDGNVYITLIGVRGRSKRIKLKGDFERNDFDYTYIKIRDIHPIQQIQIGHDGDGRFDGWDIDYVNVYIEHVQETYTFQNLKKISITNQKNLTLDHDGFYYLISTKTGGRINNYNLRGKVYITLIGATGIKRINLYGDFRANMVDETRERFNDIRPIKRVEIGHDAEGSWDLEYVSIYVENMEEFYVFRNNEGRMIDSFEDLPLDREGCINSFGGDLDWFPSYNITDHLGQRPEMSHRSCKQACVNEKHPYCQGVYYNSLYKACYGLLQTDKSHFTINQKYRNVYVNFRKCKT